MVLAIGLVAAGVQPARAAAGGLDASFGLGGATRWDTSSNYEQPTAVTTQPDGKIVTAGAAGGTNSILTLSRHNADGSLDTTFGQSPGFTVVNVRDYDDANSLRQRATDVAVQTDGKIVVSALALTVGGLEDTLVFLRFESDGTLDASFGGGDGVVVYVQLAGSMNQAPYGIAIDADGRILAGGWAHPDFLFVRLTADGSLDTTFGGGDGFVTTNVNQQDKAWGVALQPDGRFLLAGSAGSDFAVVRYHTDGSLDSTFSGDGKLTTNFGGTDIGYGIAVDANDRIVVAGRGPNNHLAVARYTSSGALDTSFSGDGKMTTSKWIFNSSSVSVSPFLGVTVQVDGKVVVGGQVTGFAEDLGAARLTTGGLLDTTFSGDGVAKFDSFGGQDYGHDVAIDPFGNIVVSGMGNEDTLHNRPSQLARFLGELAASACPGMTIDNTITGTPGDDVLVGTPGNDFISGGGGADTITGGGGDDCIYGGTGDDAIDGGGDNDRLFADAGDDTLTGGPGLDTIVGGVGKDIIRIAAGDVPATTTELLRGKLGSDTAELGAGLSPADVTLGAPPTFTVTDPVTGGTYSTRNVEVIADT